MKFKFKVQQYQTEAVENTIRVFTGQPKSGLAEYLVDKGKTFIVVDGKKSYRHLLTLMKMQVIKIAKLFLLKNSSSITFIRFRVKAILNYHQA